MKWFKDAPPKDGQQFLARTTCATLPYYVLYYDENYNKFYEAGGEQYMYFTENDIFAWTSLDELNKSIEKIL